MLWLTEFDVSFDLCMSLQVGKLNYRRYVKLTNVHKILKSDVSHTHTIEF